MEEPAGFYPVALDTDAATGVVVVKSLDGAVTLYAECSGRQLARSTFGNPLHFPTEASIYGLAQYGWNEPAIVVDPRTHTAIVIVTHGQLALFDLATHRLRATIHVAKEVTTLALDSPRQRIVATSFATGAIYTVDLRTHAVSHLVRVGGHPSSIVLDQTSGRVFVGNYLRPGVDVLDDQSGREITRLAISANKLSLDPTHRYLYATVGPPTTGSLSVDRGPLAPTPPTKDRFAIAVVNIDTLRHVRTLHARWTGGLAQYPLIALLAADAHTGNTLVAVCDTGGFCVLDTFNEAGALIHSRLYQFNYRLAVPQDATGQVFLSYFAPGAVYDPQLPGGVHLLDEETGQVLQSLPTDFAGILAMSYNSQRHVLALTLGLWKILPGPPMYINDASALKFFYHV